MQTASERSEARREGQLKERVKHAAYHAIRGNLKALTKLNGTRPSLESQLEMAKNDW